MAKVEKLSTTPRNQELYEKFTYFIKSATVLLKKRHGDSLPITESIVPEKLKEGGWITKLKEEFEFSGTIYDDAESISKLKEAKNLADLLLHDEMTSRWVGAPRDLNGSPLGKKETYLYIVQNHLSKPLNRYLKETEAYKFNKNICANIYQEFENFLYSDAETFTIIAPLGGFRSDSGGLRLDENLLIRKITLEEHQRLFKDSGGTFPLFEPGVMGMTHVIATYYTRKISDAHNVFPSMDLFKKVITALRIFKKGGIGFTRIYDKPDHWMSPFGFGSAARHEHLRYLGGNYELNNSEIPNFLNFWKDFASLDQKKYRFLDIATERFYLSQERIRQPEDKLIDIMIGLEALYLRDNKELSYKLSTRAAFMLEKNPGKRKKIFALVKKAYGIRSDIVHGSKLKKEISVDGTKMNIYQLADESEEVLRSSIHLFINLSKEKSEKQINKILEEAIFASTS